MLWPVVCLFVRPSAISRFSITMTKRLEQSKPCGLGSLGANGLWFTRASDLGSNSVGSD